MRTLAPSLLRLVPLLLTVTGCSSSSPATRNPVASDASARDAVAVVDAATDVRARDAAADHAAAPGDAAKTLDGATSGATYVTRFDKSAGQLPEGLWQAAGQTFASWAPLASVVTVTESGTTSPFGSLPGAADTFTLGITSDATGALYIGIGAAAVVGGAPADAGPVAPAPGVYKVPAGGGPPVAWSLGSNATPPMLFANGLVFQGSNLLVADSEGTIYRIDATGTASVWSQDPLLQPSQAACAGVVPLAVGANGIAVDATDVYATNTNYGRLIRVPIESDGSAGTAVVVAEDCAQLAGADGLVKDQDGSYLIAVNAQNRIARVTTTGAISVVSEGAPLATPASVVIDGTTTPRRLLVTNSTFFTAPDAGVPGIVEIPLP